jgi:hypothetical protein
VSNTNSQPEKQDFSAFLLGLIRAATLRCDLDATELKSVGVALKNGWINTEQACAAVCGGVLWHGRPRVPPGDHRPGHRQDRRLHQHDDRELLRELGQVRH